jgi:hypothetical protein
VGEGRKKEFERKQVLDFVVEQGKGFLLKVEVDIQ